MKGVNKIVMNTPTMIEAVEDYLNSKRYSNDEWAVLGVTPLVEDNERKYEVHFEPKEDEADGE